MRVCFLLVFYRSVTPRANLSHWGCPFGSCSSPSNTPLSSRSQLMTVLPILPWKLKPPTSPTTSTYQHPHPDSCCPPRWRSCPCLAFDLCRRLHLPHSRTPPSGCTLTFSTFSHSPKSSSSAFENSLHVGRKIKEQEYKLPFWRSHLTNQ